VYIEFGAVSDGNPMQPHDPNADATTARLPQRIRRPQNSRNDAYIADRAALVNPGLTRRLRGLRDVGTGKSMRFGFDEGERDGFRLVSHG
jgi:hypothetical protein